MKTRLIASLLALAALAYACGPRARTEAEATFPVQQQGFALASMSAPAVARSIARSITHERSVKKESGSLTANFAVAQKGDAVEFSFRVVNATGRRVEVTFPSGQAYDFIVVDSVGREVWRWAAGRIFTQSVQNKLLASGEVLSIGEKWMKPKAGKYRAIARLHSSNYPLQQETDFERK